MNQPLSVPAASKADGAARCAQLTALYDGACPLCRREVGMNQGITPLKPVAWRDLREKLAANHKASSMTF